MNKDTVVASFIGFGLGLVAAIGLWVVPRVLPKTAPAQPQAKQEVAGEQTQANTSENFEVTNPTDGEIVTEKSVTVAGSAKNAKLIVVSTASGSAVLTPEADGAFSTPVSLLEGGTEITITQYTETTEETKNVFVYYFSESI